MCFAPQRRALFRHLNFQKCSDLGVLCTFWLRNVLRATTACTFSRSELPKVLRPWCVLYILTSKCASRHNGVHFFDISTSKSAPTLVCFVHFDFEMCFAPQQRALFQHLNCQKWSGAGVFCTFWLRNVLRATTACTFWTSQLPKVVREWYQVLQQLQLQLQLHYTTLITLQHTTTTNTTTTTPTLHYTTLQYTEYIALHDNYNCSCNCNHNYNYHYITLHYITLHYTNYTALHYNYNYTTLHYTALHYTNYTALHYNYKYTTLHWLHYITSTAHDTTLQLQLQLQLHYFPLHYAALHHTTSSSCGKVTTATIATTPKNTTPTTCRSISGFALPSVIHNNQPLL